MKISVLTPTIRGAEALKLPLEGLLEQTFDDFEWIPRMSEIKDTGSDFNKTMNEMIRQSEGELLVFLQDYIKPNPKGLEKFWEAYQNGGEFMTAPMIKDGKEDWRVVPEANMTWQKWEIDWGACPKEAIYDIGGFDEELDNFWGFDNVNVGLRAELNDYSFSHLPENKAYGKDHDSEMEHPYRERRNPTFHNSRLDEFRQGLSIDYLSQK
jgi:glycosyltransferase involved in cell wall biosynthesis